MTDTTEKQADVSAAKDGKSSTTVRVRPSDTWQETLNRSAALFGKSDMDRKKASALLWEGGKSAIESWMPVSDEDASAENFYNEVKTALGEARKGDASKIKTVALAVKENGLVLATYPNLSKAYAEAKRLTTTVQAQADEDAAAEKAVEALGSVGATASTPEDAAKVVLSKGVDEAARLLLDALGATNDAAHRALARAISSEIAGRVKPVAKTVKAGPKAGATQATKDKTTKPVAAKDGATKAKPKAAPKQAEKQTAKPVQKAKPVTAKKAAPAKPAPEAEFKAPEPAKKKAAPVRRPVKR
jgi:hypothetical protein